MQARVSSSALGSSGDISAYLLCYGPGPEGKQAGTVTSWEEVTMVQTHVPWPWEPGRNMLNLRMNLL